MKLKNLLQTPFIISVLFCSCFSAQEKVFVPFQQALKNPTEVKRIKFYKQSEINQVDKFPNLEEINASWANLDSIPVKLFALTHLTYLDIHQNKLQSISPLLGNLKNLNYLDLSENKLTGLPASCSSLKNLTYLNLLINPLVKFPEMIPGFQKLESLTISGRFRGVPDALFSMTALKKLDAPDIFYNVSLVKLVQLKNLETLALHMNGLKIFPPEICQLTNLKSIYLYGNPITQIPKEIGNLSKLEFLMIQHVQIIPPEIKKCVNLKKLSLQMTHLEKESLENLFSVSSLEHLDLAACEITALPENINTLKNLKILVLTKNNLSALPQAFGTLDSLRVLEIKTNQFTIFPPQICELKNLDHLYMDGNPIPEIPACILNLNKLERLDMEAVRSFPIDLLKTKVYFHYAFDQLIPEMQEKVTRFNKERK